MARQIALLTLFAFLHGCAARDVVYGLPVTTMGRQIASAPAEVWAVSGYLHDSPGRKVYVTIRENRIQSVGPEKPRLAAGNLIETEATIFPGFMDMHSHVKYNVLPLWDLAKSQFLNRFEWRAKFPPYKDAVSANMKGIKGDMACAAVRWAEVKAAAGGATAIQGIGGDSKCARGMGVNNIEIPDDMGGVKLRAMTDVILPDLIGSVFVKHIEPEMKKGLTYERAYEKMLEEQKVKAWVKFFVEEPRTIGNGLKLLVGNDFDFSSTQMSERDFTAAEPRMRKFLMEAPYNAKENQANKQIEAMRKWIFGVEGKTSYLKARKDEKAAFDFLSKGGVLTIPSPIRRYIGMFESSVRSSALNYFQDSGPKAIMAHIAEGMRRDNYNRLEYQYLKQFGLNRKGLVMIHAVGLERQDLQDAARNEISIVWSPFSNLLLYGETLDVATAKSVGVNLTLGADWTPTGSKNILDELKIARRYLDKSGIKTISNKDLVDMVTVNAAKALQLEKEMGAVKAGYLANLTLVQCPVARDVYECVIKAQQKDIALVVANGHGLYGDVEPIKALARIFRDSQEPELLPRRTPTSGAGCDFRKAIRFQTPTDYDNTLRAKGLDFRSVEQLQHQLNLALAKSESRRQKAQLDPLFNCEDEKYTKRFEAYIERELDQNLRQRPSARRSEFNLLDNWTPFTLTSDEVADDDHDQ